MKKLLFILPSFEVGGTVTSFLSLYDNIKDNYDIEVLTMSNDEDSSLAYTGKIKKSDLLIYSHVCAFNAVPWLSWKKPVVLLIKLIKRVFFLLGINFEPIIYRRCAAKISVDYDFVIAYQEGCATRLASYLKHNNKIAWVHCDYQNYPENKHDVTYYTSFRKVVCVSEYTARSFVKFCPCISNKVVAINNLLDYDRIIRKSIEPILDSRFSADTFIILSVGRIHPIKRFEVIPLIAKDLISRGLTFKWYIIGPNCDTPTYNALQNRIDENALRDKVICLGNRVNPYPYFKHSSLLVSTSYSEACPMIFHEAKALGLPMVSANFGSSYEFIDNGVTGVIVPLEDIADAIASLIVDKERYNNIKYNLSEKGYSNLNALNAIDHLLQM